MRKFKSYAYEIAIKSNKDTAINLEMKEQIPLLTAENIKLKPLILIKQIMIKVQVF
ncbi:MAG: hypothetical protein J6O88_13220 [Chryseobacterium sp.]|uniref:hypothetical protein n=1 Tax=Chryseobacterium sp. TaxID=1871047 RepID=UPI001B07ABA7|nr:hypothetical protein [Chryseobacterium sp.]MBO6185627.1 hypothetical protein [Chryseobacterium sp.]